MSFKLSNGFPSHLGKNAISFSQSLGLHSICSLLSKPPSSPLSLAYWVTPASQWVHMVACPFPCSWLSWFISPLSLRFKQKGYLITEAPLRTPSKTAPLLLPITHHLTLFHFVTALLSPRTEPTKAGAISPVQCYREQCLPRGNKYSLDEWKSEFYWE